MEKDCKEILSQWGIKLKSIRSDLKTPGSPDRYLKSLVVQDTKGAIFILEKIAFVEVKHRITLSNYLEIISNSGIKEIAQYLKNLNGEFVTEHKLRTYQLRRYVDGVKLDRKNYFNEEWRGTMAAEILLKMKAVEIPVKFDEYTPLSKHVEKLYHALKTKGMAENIYKFIVENYYPVEEKIGVTFCHGDYHPLNIIWGKESINSVIDWEFAGFKESLYDVANMVGCIGSEDPELIFTGMSKSFVRKISQSGCFQNALEYLPEFIIALRYAGWLSLWLKAGDNPLITREILYMESLIKNHIRYKMFFMSIS